jgi:hypothetical protein
VTTVQQIYDSNYRFAVPPPQPVVTAEAGDGYVRLSWDDKAERGADPVTGEFDFEGYRIYRSTDPEFRDPRVISTGTGSGPIGNGRPIAQFDLIDQRTGFSEQVVQGVAYYLGDDSGLVHTWIDTTVTNGQEYYYAVTSYDYGSRRLEFYPSENAILASRTLRGGLILPDNVVAVRPNPKVLGFVPADIEDVTQSAGRGKGTVAIQVVNSGLVPDGHLFKIAFAAPGEDSIRATSYSLIDSTTHEILFETGRDLDGEGSGPVGAGLLPLVQTQRSVLVDEAATGFESGGPTNTRLKVGYQPSLPIDLRRPGYPENISIIFHDAVVDTSLEITPFPARPIKFEIIAHEETGDRRLRCRVYDIDGDGTLSHEDDFIDIVTYARSAPTVPRSTWFLKLDLEGQEEPIRPPAEGDVFRLRVTEPFGAEDVFVFTARGEWVDEALAQSESSFEPYVVPNPYVGSASFEPERFAVSGRGERRIEFRGIPQASVIRIYTVRGELVQTLRQDGSNDGYVAWNLRTKDNLDVAPGLYVFHVDGGELGSKIGKFAIIK